MDSDDYAELRKLVNQFGPRPRIARSRSFYSFPDIPAKKLDNALNAYGKRIEKSTVIGLGHDNTGISKGGFLFTTSGLHGRDA